jgi:hypothetical protein
MTFSLASFFLMFIWFVWWVGLWSICDVVCVLLMADLVIGFGGCLSGLIVLDEFYFL